MELIRVHCLTIIAATAASFLLDVDGDAFDDVAGENRGETATLYVMS